jgi:hypothetical protein
LSEIFGEAGRVNWGELTRRGNVTGFGVLALNHHSKQGRSSTFTNCFTRVETPSDQLQVFTTVNIRVVSTIQIIPCTYGTERHITVPLLDRILNHINSPHVNITYYQKIPINIVHLQMK